VEVTVEVLEEAVVAEVVDEEEKAKVAEEWAQVRQMH